VQDGISGQAVGSRRFIKSINCLRNFLQGPKHGCRSHLFDAGVHGNVRFEESTMAVRPENQTEHTSQPNGGPRLRPGKEVESHEDAAGGIKPAGDHRHLLNSPTNTTWRANNGEKIVGFQKNAVEKKK
jgi:hypothetical protein